MLTQQRLKELLIYNPLSGMFRRNIARGGQKKGSIAGTKSGRAVSICVDGKVYWAHRLAILYMTGKWPKEMGDHKNRNPRNNRWTNIRPATRAQNACNSKRRSDNTTGFKGVSQRGDKFIAYIQVNRKMVFLGYFGSRKAAYRVRRAAARKNYQEFAA